MSRRAALLAAALALTVSTAARAQPAALDEAAQRIREVRYQEAAELLDGALESGRLDLASHAEAHRMAGEVKAALGDADAAREHFLRYLVLHPKGAPSPGSSPKITAPFEQARARLAATGPLEVDARADRRGGGVRVRLTVTSDPLELVSGVAVFYRLGDDPREQVARVPVALTAELDVPPTNAVRFVVAALDERGNELARVGTWRAPLTVAGAPAPRAALSEAAIPPAPRTRRPLYARWYPWAGLAALSAGAGGYFAWQLGSTADELERVTASSSEHRYSEARALERRGDRQALMANLAFGVAAATAAISVALAVRGSYESTATPVIAPTGDRTGAGVTASWSF